MITGEKNGEAVYASHDVLKRIRRNVGLVFQNFNLFPHFSVLRNITEAPVSVMKVSKEEAEAKAMELLKKMGLSDKAKSYPCELSGGQQQRVAIARALVLSPKFLLLDEPLSALDAKVRQKVRVELKNLQSKLGITTIMVTHDQEEALALNM